MGESSLPIEQTIDIDDLVAKLEESAQSQNGWLTIPKVPVTLRNILDFPKWIEPSVISIGPYYHDHDNLQEGEKLKPLWAKRFIDDSNQGVRCLYQKIERKIRELRNCYDSQAILKYNDKQLATMFVLDGCFLLHFIRSFCSNKEGGLNGSNFTNHHIAYIQQDLFLLENQLPFQVLKLLFQDAQFQDSNSMEELIKEFVTSKIIMSRGKLGRKLKDEGKEPFHLLDLLRGVLLGKLKNISKPPVVVSELQQVVVSEPQQQMQEVDEKGNSQETNKKQIQLSSNRGILGSTRTSNKEEHERCLWHSYRNVQELMAVGIHFKPSETSFLTDISFTSYFGITGCLKLPPVTIDRSTMIIFLNLIAQESSSNLNDFGVISYLCFLDSLMDHWDDVQELQADRVLHNFVGDQKEVAQFFNHVCGKLLPDVNSYKDVTLQIEKHVERHYNSKLRMLLIQCKHTYFSSPWSVIALVGALLGLFLTAVEAYTSVFLQSNY